MKNKAVFLDRDGVINEDPPHYAHRLDQLKLIEGSAKAIQLLNTQNFLVIVISNQSGVARGYYKECDVKVFNEGMNRLLERAGAHIDALYFCPHHPEGIVKEYRQSCNCRKPEPGMIFQAASEYNIDMSNSFIVGDKWTDIEAGISAGLKTILVRTGHGKAELSQKTGHADYVASDLFDAITNYVMIMDTLR